MNKQINHKILTNFGIYTTLNYFVFLTIFLILSGCELFVIGSSTKRTKTVEINQKSPAGTVMLFKTELDSNNISAAAMLLIKPNGSRYLAIEKYELYDDLNCLGKMIAKQKVTSLKTDSISEKKYNVNIEIGYLKTISFTTNRFNDSWYIVSYKE